MSESFDLQAAWLRRFQADAEGNMGAFALRLKEAMPQQVTLHERKSLFSRTARITGVTVELNSNQFNLDLAEGRLKATIKMIVRGVTLNTKDVDPGDWFARLARETQASAAHAEALSASLAAFMAH